MIKNFLKGFGDIRKGFGYLLTHRGLIKFLIPPTIVNLVLFIGLLYILLHFYGPLFSKIASQLGGLDVETNAWWMHIVAALLWLVRGFLHVLLGLILVIVLVIIMLFVSQIINGPFYDFLSEAVEKKETGAPDGPFSWRRLAQEGLRTILLELKKLMFFISMPTIMLLINFIPVIGSLAYTLLSNLFAAWDLGFNFMSYSMGRKVVPFRTQVGFGLKHKARLIGFGLPLMIPFFNILFAPVFVVGGTLMYLELEGPGHDSLCSQRVQKT